MTAAALIGIVLLVFLAFGVFLSRRQAETKRQAIQDLQREKEALGPVNVKALAEEEAAELGLAGIRGAEGIPPVVLLKVWKSSSAIVERCASKDQLRYELAPGVDPTLAAEPDVTLVCDTADDSEFEEEVDEVSEDE